MPGSNAGLRRNRLPAGEKPILFKAKLSTDAATALRQAARASGDLSDSLYLERLTALVVAEHGELPLLNDELPILHDRRKTTAAA